MSARFTGIFRFVLIQVLLVFTCCKTENRIDPINAMPADYSLKLSEAQIQLANISTAEIKAGTLSRKLSLTGVLKVNENSAATVSARVPGRIEKLFFRNTGEVVNQGDKLYEFYSEDLVTAQREYSRLQSNNWNFSAQYEPRLAAEERLLLMGMTKEQILQLAKDNKILFRITIFSPVSGKIRSVNVSEGDYAANGQVIFELADDRTLWAESQVYPGEVQFIRTGLPVKVTIPSAAGKTVRSAITFISPSFENGRNITSARTEIKNHDGLLHPGMLALIETEAVAGYGVVIPSSAILKSSGKDRVWIWQGDGLFSPRNIQTGIQSGDSVLVTSGLRETEKLVTSGVYLLNSEMILKYGSDFLEAENPDMTAENR